MATKLLWLLSIQPAILDLPLSGFLTVFHVYIFGGYVVRLPIPDKKNLGKVLEAPERNKKNHSNMQLK